MSGIEFDDFNNDSDMWGMSCCGADYDCICQPLPEMTPDGTIVRIKDNIASYYSNMMLNQRLEDQ